MSTPFDPGFDPSPIVFSAHDMLALRADLSATADRIGENIEGAIKRDDVPDDAVFSVRQHTRALARVLRAVARRVDAEADYLVSLAENSGAIDGRGEWHPAPDASQTMRALLFDI